MYVERHGTRKSRVFSSREDAEKWASEMEALTGKDYVNVDAARERREWSRVVLLTNIPPRVLEANAEIPHKHDEILQAAVRSAKASGIYFLVRGDEVVYVGQSLDMLHRIARHRREGRSFDRYACMECEPERLDALEALYIAAFAPRENMSFGRKRDH